MEQILKLAFLGALTLTLGAARSSDAQSSNATPAEAGIPNQQSASPPQAQNPIRSTASVVLVPALVKDKSGETVDSLTADDFVLTDNGVPQPLHLESDNDTRPIAVVVIVETGGEGADHLRDYADLSAVMDNVIGDVPHRVAVVSFDSKPRVELRFTSDTDAASQTIANLTEGDTGAAILDALVFGIDLLREAPPAYRRAVLL